MNSEETVKKLIIDLFNAGAEGKALEDLQSRKLVATRFGGNYGQAGTVIILEGSPPRGTIIAIEPDIGPAWYPPTFYYIDMDRSRRLGDQQANTVREFLNDPERKARPAEAPCVVVYSHSHGMTVHACSSEEEAFRVGADIVLEQIDGPAAEDAQHILDLIRAEQFKEAIATYCEKMNDSAGMGEGEIIELYSGEPTKALTAQRLAEKALNISNDRFNTSTLI